MSKSNAKQIPNKPTAPVKITKSAYAPALVLTGFNNPVGTLAWHPQKPFLVAANGSDYWFMTWDIQALFNQHNQSPSSPQHEYIEIGNTQPLIAWSSDGKHLAVVNNETNKTNNFQTNVSIYLYATNPQSPSLPKELTSKTAATSIALQTSNAILGFKWLQDRYIVTVEQDNTSKDQQFLLRMSDITQPGLHLAPFSFSGTLTLPPTITITTTPEILTISPDRSTIAISLTESILVGHVSIVEKTLKWQPAPVSPLLSGSKISTGLGYVAWSADGNEIISASSENNNNAPVFWNWRNRKPQPQALSKPARNNSSGYAARPTAIASNPASTHPCFAVGYDNGDVYLWNAVKGSSPIETLDTGGINAQVVAMTWSQDGHWLAASFGDINASILIWKL
jgi:WD40 repeat protein